MRTPLLLLMVLLLVAAAAAPAEELSLAQPITRRFPFGDLRFRPTDTHLTANGQRIAIPFLAEGAEPREHARLLVADFNFDGALDLMVPVSTGYGGVNWFYALYRFDPTTRRFARLRGGTDEDSEFCNPAPDAPAKILKVPCKSGPAWYEDAFKFDAAGLRPYRHRRSQLVHLSGFPDDRPVYLLTYRDAAGRKLKTEVVEAEDSAKPAVRAIPSARVYLHTEPHAKARTPAYIVKDDQVELLDIREVGDVQWLQVAYRGNSTARPGRLVRWIRLDEDL